MRWSFRVVRLHPTRFVSFEILHKRRNTYDENKDGDKDGDEDEKDA